ncbi:carboxylate/amino acid/amine transporter [Pokkaliibacter sp. MBI-7]|uniref:carboxylate/amino acid/amine transporter n=1 Tax=Pokkaliibacter sp. MBI-7 TaxID=3040600 RepID=UPI00244AB575|nr:carboxylate/amino acid/amine transporter [Pokkaliibacter sp. MBI-7]MDH2432307.1 carboxylate/amino acid/amine transporter [Pokkaliibacter sp. MBI-7]
MTYLVGVTLLWAFSFSLIGVYLAGQVDAYFAVLTRIVLATLVFLPFLKWRNVRPALAARLMTVGALQLGIMYVFYYKSFLLLSVPEVLIFTIFTPVYVTLIYDLLNKRFSPGFLLAAVGAVVGAAIIRYDNLSEDYLLGFLVVQGANLCFAMGQVGYKVIMERERADLPQHTVFGLFYMGALVVGVISFLIWGGEKYPTTSTQWGVLLWLGAVASGAGYFLWNKGATLVNAGTLAVMNNALIPAGLVVNLLIWNREADMPRLLIGSGVMFVALYVAERYFRNRALQAAS